MLLSGDGSWRFARDVPLRWGHLGSSGTPVSRGNACDDLGRIVLADAGTYAIEISSDGTAAGAYAFEFRSSP